jgi:GNAT superfamily N-acetyltransferase
MSSRQILAKAQSITTIDKETLGPKIKFTSSPTPELSSFFFTLTKKNMESLYNAAGDDWRWHDTRKMEELTHEDMRYLIFSEAQEILGFMAFRFETDLGDMRPIVYIYEVQTVVAGRGVGAALMAALDRVCLERTGVRKSMLTVLRINEAAVKFYRRLSWREDEDSPEGEVYLILCKFL